VFTTLVRTVKSYRLPNRIESGLGGYSPRPFSIWILSYPISRSTRTEQATEQQRVNQAVKEAKQLRGTEHPVLGKPVATMPAREFFRLTAKYGHEEVHSKKFLQYYNKKFPELSPNQA
jgi:hypothetical protein